jgi:cytochrome c oxidase subunit 2
MPNIPIRPETASNFATQFNPLFGALLALSFVFGGGVLATVVLFAVRYREGSKVERKRPSIATPILEACLIGIPMVFGLAIFAWGAKLYTAERTIPRNATEIFVVGKQWMWQMYHANGVRELNQLTLPIGQPVRLTMVSQDVIHAFYVPAFRIQYYVLPGRYTAQWFIPTKTGTFLLLCNQYCGMDHSRMVGHITILTKADYSSWLAKQNGTDLAPTQTLLARGQNLFTEKQCASCHSSRDNAKAPSLIGVFGKVRHLRDGTHVTADADYLRNAITHPELCRLAGEPESMPSYAYLSPQDVWALIHYVESQ